MVFYHASIVHEEYLHSLNVTKDDNALVLMKVTCTCRGQHYLPKLTGIVVPYKWPPGKCIDKTGGLCNCPTFNACQCTYWCELASVHAQNKYWRNHIFTQAIDYGGQCMPMIDWILTHKYNYTKA